MPGWQASILPRNPVVMPSSSANSITGPLVQSAISPAAPPEEGRRLFDYLAERARARLGAVQTGEFGANMQVSLTNDGPVTFWLQVPPEGAPAAG